MAETQDDADLWFLPGPLEDEPDYLPPGPAPEAKEFEIVDASRAASWVAMMDCRCLSPI